MSFGFLLVALLFLARLFFLQVVKTSDYSDLADRQYIQPSNRSFDRGNIFFTNQDQTLFSAATLKQGFFVAINPEKIKSATSTYAQLSKIFPLDAESFSKKAAKSDDPYEEIANRLDQNAADQITALKLSGVSVYKERWRFYPGGSLAGNTIGLLAYQGDDYAGRYGLEREYDSTLSRSEGQSFVNYFAEIFLSVGESLFAKKQSPQAGDIVTTIEPTVQSTLEKVLANTKEEWHPDLLGGVIMNPKTGEIYALAINPAYDPGAKQDNISILNNPLVDRVYEMGSIIKPLTMAAGLDAGVITPQTTYDDKGFLIINGSKVSNYDGRARGIIPMQEILNQSLNVGASFVAGKLGHTQMRNYFLNYGLGEPTGIDLPEEVSGLVKNLSSPRDVEYATASFGQGIAISPIETARALASLGNGGLLVTPHLVKEIQYTTGLDQTVTIPPPRQILKASTSDEITRMLVTVVDKALANGSVSLPHYRIAAKTGTAQIVDPATGKYYPDRYLHSFFGYFPAYEPRFIIFLYMVYPKNVNYASQTLTAPFMDLTKFLLSYYQVPPDR